MIKIIILINKMGCTSYKSSHALAIVPDFRQTRKGPTRADELRLIDEVFTESHSEYVKLKLDLNEFRTKRLNIKSRLIQENLDKNS